MRPSYKHLYRKGTPSLSYRSQNTVRSGIYHAVGMVFVSGGGYADQPNELDIRLYSV